MRAGELRIVRSAASLCHRLSIALDLQPCRTLLRGSQKLLVGLTGGSLLSKPGGIGPNFRI